MITVISVAGFTQTEISHTQVSSLLALSLPGPPDHPWCLPCRLPYPDTCSFYSVTAVLVLRKFSNVQHVILRAFANNCFLYLEKFMVYLSIDYLILTLVNFTVSQQLWYLEGFPMLKQYLILRAFGNNLCSCTQTNSWYISLQITLLTLVHFTVSHQSWYLESFHAQHPTLRAFGNNSSCCTQTKLTTPLS